MIVSDRHRLVFTHIPKNAGTSIREWFTRWVPDAKEMPNVTKHMTPHHVHTRHMEEYTYFAVVRNPYDRFLSIFHHYHFAMEYGNENLLSRWGCNSKKKIIMVQ